MNEKLSTSHVVSIGLMLFAMFFGAGNLIFPPALGQAAGTNMTTAILGFVVTGVGMPLIAVVAVALAGGSFDDIAGRIHPKFAVFLTVVIYLLIGPLFAMPRTGSVGFELGITPFLPEAMVGSLVPSIIFTAIFFGLTYILALNPSKLVGIIGKVLTPILLISIAVITFKAVTTPIGSIGAPIGDYATQPFFKGFIEGYLTMDAIAALVFAMMIVQTVKGFGITSNKSVAKYTILAGSVAALGLAVVYIALAYVGATSIALGEYSNGGQLLAIVTNYLLGSSGNVVLGIAVILACLTTSIGLTTSCGEYFHNLCPSISYKTIIMITSIFSFVISNVGLTTLINFSLPLLIVVYPVLVALVLFSFFNGVIGGRRGVYIGAMTAAFVVSVIESLNNSGITLGAITDLTTKLPFFELGIGWLIPTIVCGILGYFLPLKPLK